MKDVFRENGMYTYHIMYDTGIIEALKDSLLHKGNKTKERVGGAEDWFDRVFEKFAYFFKILSRFNITFFSLGRQSRKVRKEYSFYLYG